jgi:hypothetical protein
VRAARLQDIVKLSGSKALADDATCRLDDAQWSVELERYSSHHLGQRPEALDLHLCAYRSLFELVADQSLGIRAD